MSTQLITKTKKILSRQAARTLIIGSCYALFTPPVSLHANVIGVDFQSFNPTTNGLCFVTVQCSEILAPGIFNLGVFANYAVNSLPEFENEKPVNNSRTGIRNTALYSDINMGVGLPSLGIIKEWEMGINLPAVLQQTIFNSTSRIQYNNRGFNELRLNLKMRLGEYKSTHYAMVLTQNYNLIKNNPYSGSGGGPTYNIEFVAHKQISRFFTGLNIGYRKKDPGDKVEGFPAEPFHDQLNASFAMSYFSTTVNTKVIFELYGSMPVDYGKSEHEILQKSAEALGGIKIDVSDNLSFHAGVTTGIIRAPSSPDYRLYSGINWAQGPVWKEKPKEALSVSLFSQIEEVEIDSSYDEFVLDNIHFKSGSWTEVESGSTEQLADLAKHLDSLPQWSKLIIEGHTDSIGSDSNNLTLSQNRANTIKKLLVERHGINAEMVEAIGYGETRPIADNSSYQGRQLNRRVEIRIFR